LFTFDSFHEDSTDQDLWLGLRKGDQLCFTILFERYHTTLYNYGSKLTTNSAAVEDAVQDVFIDIWRLRQNLSGNVISVKFYLYRALRRRIHLAHSKFPETREISAMYDHEEPVSMFNSETTLIENESSSVLAARIQQLLSVLPERQIEALTLRYFDDFSIAEIALIMGVNEKSVRNFIYKALTSLRQNSQSLVASALIPCLLSVF
jgi:RNA polymerase sigma factor (sigma-70 family)